jgi:hypothetical protein
MGGGDPRSKAPGSLIGRDDDLHSLSLLGLDYFMTGDWEELQPLADEHTRLCEPQLPDAAVHRVVAAGHAGRGPW